MKDLYCFIAVLFLGVFLWLTNPSLEEWEENWCHRMLERLDCKDGWFDPLKRMYENPKK